MNLSYRLAEVRDSGSRAYVEYYVLNPGSGDLERKREYCQINRIKDPLERRKRLIQKRDEINGRLISGWSPFKNKIEQSLDEKGILQLVQDVLVNKKRYQKENAYAATNSHIKPFISWLQFRGFANLPAHQISRTHIADFLTMLLRTGVSNRTRNNYLVDISAVFQYLLDNYENLLSRNPCKGIAYLPVRSETHVSYNDAQLRAIVEWCNEKDSYLGLFCKFIIYEFMRPNQIIDLKVKHFDITQWEITIPASIDKTNRRKIKPIQQIFKADIVKLGLQNFHPECYVFSRYKEPRTRRIGENHFGKRFRKLKKDLCFTREFTMYGLRHTYVRQLIRNGAHPNDVMRLTGHTTWAAFEKYLKDIDALPAKDLSSLYSIKW
jgi:integrase